MTPSDWLPQPLPTGTLWLRVIRAQWPLQQLLTFAARANAKRGFLFLSKVLGKHWPSVPSQMAQVHTQLALQVQQAQLPGPVVFVAMAETAIGLGQGVFEAYLRQKGAAASLFLHTTRYRLGDAPLVEFEEAHSHAPRQFLHLPQHPNHQALLASARSLVLVDDEASTGNTFVNLANALRQHMPQLQRVQLVAITQFMPAEQALPQALHARFGLPVGVSALLEGQFRFEDQQTPTQAPPAQRYNPLGQSGASHAFGRAGLTAPLHLHASALNTLMASLQPQQPLLVLGTGEFMHPAFLLAQHLENAGYSVVVQSTSRSPILTAAGVTQALCFEDNYQEGIANYLYNVTPLQYHQVLICHETPATPALFALARLLQGRLLHFVAEHLIEEIPVC